MHPQDVDARLDRCRALFYYRADQLTPSSQAAQLEAFFGALSGVPAWFTDRAFDEWIRRGIRQPLPGDIANRARQLYGDAQERLALSDAGGRAKRDAEERVYGPRDAGSEDLTDEQKQRRGEFAASLGLQNLWLDPTATRAGARVYDPFVPTWPEPKTDEEIKILLADKHAARHSSATIWRFREREGISQPGAAIADRARLRERRPEG